MRCSLFHSLTNPCVLRVQVPGCSTGTGTESSSQSHQEEIPQAPGSSSASSFSAIRQGPQPGRLREVIWDVLEQQ